MKKDDFYNMYSGFVTDKRIVERIEKTFRLMLERGSSIVNKFAENHKDKIGTYRMLSNKRFNHKDLMAASFNKCNNRIIKDNIKHVLVIQDTTEFNYNGIKQKLKSKNDKDIGPTSNNNVAGYFCHPGLVVNPEEDTIYGFSSAIFYNRSWDKKDKYERKYKQLPIEEKESFRWLETAENTKKAIDKDIQLTIIGDRESDIYEEFARVPDSRTNVLVRASSNRYIVGGNNKLFEYIAEKPIAGEYELEVSGINGRNKRVAKMELRYSPIIIPAPNDKRKENKQVQLYAIEVKESNETTPKNESPILWYLLTTHHLDSFEDAKRCVEWYKKRWLIEELFRVLKTKGFRIESSQLGSGESLKKLLALTLETAIQIMMLKLSLHQEGKKSLSMVFEKEERFFLKILNKKIEGKTKKSLNPYQKNSLAWATWVLARIAGWSGYIKSHGPPGYITIKEGYDKFKIQYEIFKLIKDVYKD